VNAPENPPPEDFRERSRDFGGSMPPKSLSAGCRGARANGTRGRKGGYRGARGVNGTRGRKGAVAECGL